ncbi:TfoX/Sxy family protein [Isoptericola jiangsuensis]|uniref:TfoX/Sxy family protein n=1 Tax=Isoptericola jiangsuensis TaxID=548579 RepID=UPI003AAB74F6
MAYDEDLAVRVRRAVGARADVVEQRMFGGLAFMVNTHMAVGITRDVLMVRVGTDGHDAALADGAHELVMGTRTMHGTVGVDPTTTGDDAALDAWVARGVDRALGLAAKR